jgi:hypothetical protein
VRRESVTPFVAEIRDMLLARVGRENRFQSIGSELLSLLGLGGSAELLPTATDLIGRYAVDRVLVEATTLLDVEGNAERQPFRASLVHSLGLVVVGRLLDAAGVPEGRPRDANPAAVFTLLDEAYGILAAPTVKEHAGASR